MMRPCWSRLTRVMRSAGFYLIEARDLNEAIQLAGDIPAARVGCVEVRPVRQLDVDPAAQH